MDQANKCRVIAIDEGVGIHIDFVGLKDSCAAFNENRREEMLKKSYFFFLLRQGGQNNIGSSAQRLD